MNSQRKDLVKMVVTNSPCDKCPYFWEEKDRSCRDECQEYKKWQLSKLEIASLRFAYGEHLPTIDELGKQGKVKVEHDRP